VPVTLVHSASQTITKPGRDIALVILDLHMNAVDDFTLAAGLRSHPETSRTPLLLLADRYLTEHHLFEGYSLAPVDFVTTPVIDVILRNKVRTLLEVVRLRRSSRPRAQSLPREASHQTTYGTPDASRAALKILAVEDNPAVMRMLAKVLERAGYTVVAAQDHPTAAERAREHADLALLVTDINLPGASGIEVAQTLRALYPELPVLFMSGNTAHALKDADIPTGRVGFLQKPFLPRALLMKIREAIGIQA